MLFWLRYSLGSLLWSVSFRLPLVRRGAWVTRLGLWLDLHPPRS